MSESQHTSENKLWEGLVEARMARDDHRTLRIGRRGALVGGAAVGVTALVSLGASAAGLQLTGDEKDVKDRNDHIEPKAGTWKTWLISSGKELRLPPPPSKSDTKIEIEQLAALADKRDAQALARIAYWDAGSPSHRWNELLIGYSLQNNHPVNIAARNLALLHVAIYDAMVAAWDTKYAYNRPRPAEFESSLRPALPTPRSPAYPAEHAVAAGAASTVLAYLFPSDAQFLTERAEEAGQSRLLAGVDYPSDVRVGLELGRAVGARAVERGRGDGTDLKWDGTMPTGPGYWTGTNPILPMAGQWKTWVLESGSELRPAPPPAYDSAQKQAELAELRNVQRTPKMTADAYFWEYGAGGLRNHWYYNDLTSRKTVEYRLADNPPRAARAFALQSITHNDAGVACWDAKYAYWAIRPFQLDPTLKTLFPTPNHPSYPAAHASFSGAAGGILGYLFPQEAEAYTALANQAGESRIWAGIHFRSDVEAGLALGRAVAAKVVERAQRDGS